MSLENKVLERAMEEIERLKSKISNLENKKEHLKEKNKQEIIYRRYSKIDVICKERNAAMRRYSIKLFGRIYAE